MNDKMQELREKMCDKSLADVRAIIRSFDEQVGRYSKISGGGVYVWKVAIQGYWRIEQKDVPVKFEVNADLDSEAAELAFELETTWNGWMRVIALLDDELGDAWSACQHSDWAEEDDKFYDSICDAINEYLGRAIDDAEKVMKKWLTSAEDLPWDMDDDEVLDYMGVA